MQSSACIDELIAVLSGSKHKQPRRLEALEVTGCGWSSYQRTCHDIRMATVAKVKQILAWASGAEVHIRRVIVPDPDLARDECAEVADDFNKRFAGERVCLISFVE
jgi:hypothetical protein